jgi:hypothetical protein
MVNRDPRYFLIQKMIEKGDVKSFNDIVEGGFVPRTIIATDLGMKVTRFNEFLRKTELFTMEQILLIGSWCELEAKVILTLWNNQLYKQKGMFFEMQSLTNVKNLK